MNQPSEPIASVVPSDQDSAEQFTYTLVDNPSQAFKLDSATGTISLTTLGEGLINSGRIESITALLTDKRAYRFYAPCRLRYPPTCLLR